jgi:hypothetical protein
MSLKRKKREIVESVPPDYWGKFGGEDGREAAGALVARVKRDPWLQGRRAQWWLAWMEGKLRTMTSDRLRWVLDEVIKLVRPSLIRTALTAYEERQADFESRRRQNPQVRPSASASNPKAADSDPEAEFIVKVALAAVPLMTTSKNEGRRDRGRDRRKTNAGAPAGAPTS